MITKSDLNAFINGLADEDFEYGKMDCFLFTVRFLEFFHGRKFGGLHFSKYCDEESAKRYLDHNGGMVALITEELAQEPVDPTICMPGDVVVSDRVAKTPAMGVVHREGSALFKLQKRAIPIPLGFCCAGWTIESANSLMYNRWRTD